MHCKNCNSDMIVHSHMDVIHCENVEIIGEDFEADTNPVYCTKGIMGELSSAQIMDVVIYHWANDVPAAELLLFLHTNGVTDVNLLDVVNAYRELIWAERKENRF